MKEGMNAMQAAQALAKCENNCPPSQIWDAKLQREVSNPLYAPCIAKCESKYPQAQGQ
jgi:hypothetical protein